MLSIPFNEKKKPFMCTHKETFLKVIFKPNYTALFTYGLFDFYRIFSSPFFLLLQFQRHCYFFVSVKTYFSCKRNGINWISVSKRTFIQIYLASCATVNSVETVKKITSQNRTWTRWRIYVIKLKKKNASIILMQRGLSQNQCKW